MAKSVEHVIYIRDDVWEYGGQYVDGRFTCYTMKMIAPIPPPTPEYLDKKEAQRYKCFLSYKEFGKDSPEYVKAKEIYLSISIMEKT